MLRHSKQEVFVSGFARFLFVALAAFFVFISPPSFAETITETPQAVTPPATYGPPIPKDLHIASPPPANFVGPPAPTDLKVEAKPAEPTAPAAPVEGAKEDYLLLQLVINDAEMEDVVEALQRGGKLYIPLGQLSGILDFSIKVDPAAKTAKGWFMREQNTITLSEKSGDVKGKSVDFPAGSVFFAENDLYVDSELLHTWMPLDFKPDFHRMTLGIATREPLPFQAKNLRDKRHQALEQQNVPAKEQSFKKIATPYEAAQWPTVDLTVSPSYDSTQKGGRTDYSMLAVGDFGYLTSRLYAAGNIPNDTLSDLRLSFGRDDYEKKLLGFAHASSFRFGDINSASLTQVATPTLGRGFTVTNRELDRPDNFDLTNFIGDSKPGWEVELYRNGTLIDFQTVGADGRYAFRNVPILFGNNQFRLAFYGPQGQVEEINKTVNAEASLLEKGQFTYNFSADEKNKSLFGVSDPSNSGLTPSGLASVAEMEYGLTRWVTLAAGAAHTPLADGNHSYVTGGIRASVKNVLAAADTAYDTKNQGTSTRLSMSTDIHDTLLSVQQKFAHNFESEENTTLVNLIERQTIARVDRQFGDLAASLSLTRNNYAGGRQENLWTNQISKALFGGMTFTNTLRWDKDNLGLDQLTGSAFLRGYFKKVLIGAQVDYEDRPVRQVDSVKVDALYPFTPLVSDKITLTSQVSGSKVNTLENTATFDRNKYKFSITGRANDQGDYFAGITFNMSIGRIPSTGKWLYSSKTLAESGTVAVTPFVDHNYDQIREANEGPPPSSSIRIGSQTVKVDKNGTALATQLVTNVPVNIRIDAENQQANPFWSAGVDGYSVVPRPGKIITVPLPVFETSQIDGTVSVPEGVNAKDLAIELVNADGQVIRTAHSAFDGYYLIEGVMPGAYKVRVNADSLANSKLRQDIVPSLTITVSDFFVKDIHLVPVDAPKTEEPAPAPVPEFAPSAAVAPSPRKEEEEEASQAKAFDGTPMMPAVKPEEVEHAPIGPPAPTEAAPEPMQPLSGEDAAFAASAAPVAPVQAQPAPAAVSTHRSLEIVNTAFQTPAASSSGAHKPVLVIDTSAPQPVAVQKQPHLIIVNESHPVGGDATPHKPSLVIVNDKF